MATIKTHFTWARPHVNDLHRYTKSVIVTRRRKKNVFTNRVTNRQLTKSSSLLLFYFARAHILNGIPDTAVSHRNRLLLFSSFFLVFRFSWLCPLARWMINRKRCWRSVNGSLSRDDAGGQSMHIYGIILFKRVKETKRKTTTFSIHLILTLLSRRVFFAVVVVSVVVCCVFFRVCYGFIKKRMLKSIVTGHYNANIM